MKHGSLFSGIGGFDLAAQWMGWENIWQCETDSYCRTLLKKRFPEVKKIYGDIEKIRYTEPVDIITGGFPCQPFSVAGGRKGRADYRYLWPAMLRVIEKNRPNWVVCENVCGIIKMEADNVCSSLENIGYTVQPFDIASCAVGIPTVERHIWFVATTNSKRCIWFGKTALQKKQIYEKQFQGSNQGKYNGWDLSKHRVCGVGERIPNRVDRLKSLGNAIVPQVAYAIFSTIERINSATP